MIDYSKTLVGYRERIQKIALFKVFYEMDRKRKNDHSGKPVSYMDLMLISLLFFFENMLSRNYQTTKADLARYLFEVCRQTYDLKDKEYLAIASEIIEALRPSDGSKPHMDFMNFENEKPDQVSFRLLKVSGWDREANKQFYSLDEDGLELIFATKEFYSEFSLSISQLILRKQLDKGEFNLALRQIDEMRINVNSIKQNMHRLRTEIISNIISDEVYDRYRKLIDDINTQLNREHKEFLNLVGFVKETKLRFEQIMNQTENDLKLYYAVLKVNNELIEVHNMHTGLLQESIDFKNKVLEAAKESLYHMGLDRFNFDQDIVRKIMGKPMALENIRYFVKPFLKASNPHYWSPIRVFSNQRIEKKNVEKEISYYTQPAEDTKQRSNQQIQDMYEKAFVYILKNMKNNHITSNQIAGKLQQEKMSIYLKRYILQFFIVMHYYQKLNIAQIKASSTHIFHKAFLNLDEDKTIIAFAREELVEDDFTIMTNIEIRIK